MTLSLPSQNDLDLLSTDIRPLPPWTVRRSQRNPCGLLVRELARAAQVREHLTARHHFHDDEDVTVVLERPDPVSKGKPRNA